MPSKKLEQPVKGKELLALIKKNEHLSRKEKAVLAGYYLVKENGERKICHIQFLQAIVEAAQLLGKPTKQSKEKRPLSYRLTIGKNGQATIGFQYLEKLGLNPGDTLEIKISGKKVSLVIPKDNPEVLSDTLGNVLNDAGLLEGSQAIQGVTQLEENLNLDSQESESLLVA